MPAARTLAAAVFVTDPATHETLLLQPGTQIADPAIAGQITHPDAWLSGEPRPARRSKLTKAEA